MSSRKQRRRQAKERRHEYEYVYVDDDGREVEVEVDETELEQRRNGKAKRQESSAHTGRTVQPPSWTRVGRRALLFAPLMFLTVYLLGGELSMGQKLLQTLVLLAIFLPFSYLMDSLTYRAFQRRLNRNKTG